jgi:hypothetical protein
MSGQRRSGAASCWPSGSWDKLTAGTINRLLTLIRVGDVPEDEDGEPDLLRTIKSSPGGVSLSMMLAEIGKLETKGHRRVRAAGQPVRDIAPVLKEWRDQAMTESPRGP